MARSFNGTSDLIRADSAHVFATATACSFSAWVQAAASATKVFYAEAQTGSNNNNLRIQTDSTTGSHVEVIIHLTTSNLLDLVGTKIAFDGTPHHITATQDTAHHWTLYVDGQLDATATATSTSISTISNLAIGALFRSSAVLFFPGTIWDVANWSRQLSAGEAASLGAGLPASFLAPDHYWPLWGLDSPEPDIGMGSHVTGTLTGTSYANGSRVNADLLTI